MNLARRITHIGLIAALLVGSTLGLGAATSACSDNTTSGARVTLRGELLSNAAQPFTSAGGWRITLRKAALGVGPLYYFEGETFQGRWLRAIGLPHAWAHPGHYVPGGARGEMLTPVAVDLLQPSTTLGLGEGTSGAVRSATFSFRTGSGGAGAGILGDKVLVMEGTAEKDQLRRVFRVELTLSDITSPGGAPEIAGCPFEPTDFAADGTVTARVDVPLMFELVSFELVAASPDDQPVLLAGVPRNEFVRGVRAANRYQFSFRKAQP